MVADVGHSKAEDLQQQQILPEDSSADPSVNAGLGKNLLNEDDMKASYGLDTPVSLISFTDLASNIKLINFMIEWDGYLI